MTDDWDIIKTITEAEHHFNNLCFKIRALASTWLLATFAGVGFLLEKTIDKGLITDQLLILLRWAGSIGVFALWILDLQIYQKLLNAWFDARKPIEERNSNFPQMRKLIKATQPGGRASNLIKIFYICLCSAPLMFDSYVCIYKDLSKVLLVLSVLLLACFVLIIYKLTPSGHNKKMQPTQKSRG